MTTWRKLFDEAWAMYLAQHPEEHAFPFLLVFDAAANVFSEAEPRADWAPAEAALAALAANPMVSVVMCWVRVRVHDDGCRVMVTVCSSLGGRIGTSS